MLRQLTNELEMLQQLRQDVYCFLVGSYLPWVVFTNSCSFAKFGCGLFCDIEVAQVHDAFAVDEIGKGANIFSFLRRQTIGQSNY